MKDFLEGPNKYTPLETSRPFPQTVPFYQTVAYKVFLEWASKETSAAVMPSKIIPKRRWNHTTLCHRSYMTLFSEFPTCLGAGPACLVSLAARSGKERPGVCCYEDDRE